MKDLGDKEVAERQLAVLVNKAAAAKTAVEQAKRDGLCLSDVHNVYYELLKQVDDAEAIVSYEEFLLSNHV